MFPKAVSILCCIGIFAVFYRVARLLVDRPVLVSAAAGTVTAAIPSFAIWTTSGLENALLALAVVALAGVLVSAIYRRALYETRVAAMCGALAALAALSRPDGLIYGAAYAITVSLLAARGEIGRTLRPMAISVGALAAPLGMYEVWRITTFGDWLPNTARAKMQGVPGPSDLSRPAELVSYSGWLTVLLVVAVLAVGTVSAQARARRSEVLALFVPLGLAVVAFAVLRGDWMAQYRFATPIWPMAAFSFSVCSALLLASATARTRILAATVALAAGSLLATGWLAAAANFQRAPTAPLCYVAQETGIMTNSYADILRLRGGSLLAVDGGGTALTSRLAFIDLAGLVNAPIAGYWQSDDMGGLRNYVFDDVRPTFIKVWRGWIANTVHTGLLTDPRMSRDYEQLWSPELGSAVWVRRERRSRPRAPRISQNLRNRPELRDAAGIR